MLYDSRHGMTRGAMVLSAVKQTAREEGVNENNPLPPQPPKPQVARDDSRQSNSPAGGMTYLGKYLISGMRHHSHRIIDRQESFHSIGGDRKSIAVGRASIANAKPRGTVVNPKHSALNAW